MNILQITMKYLYSITNVYVGRLFVIALCLESCNKSELVLLWRQRLGTVIKEMNGLSPVLDCEAISKRALTCLPVSHIQRIFATGSTHTLTGGCFSVPAKCDGCVHRFTCLSVEHRCSLGVFHCCCT